MRDVSANSVLLVDDDPTIRNFLSSQLEKAGFKAQQAEDGIDGLVKLRDKLPKVIISDLQMPRMSGFEFISVVRRRFPSIPVIVLSGSIQRELPAEVKPDRWFEKECATNPRTLAGRPRSGSKNARSRLPPASDQYPCSDTPGRRRLFRSDLHGLPALIPGDEYA